MDHLGLLLGSAVFPLRHIVVELIQMPDGEGIAVEGADQTQLELAVAVEVDENCVAGRYRKKIGNCPLRAAYSRGLHEECALLAADHCSFMAAPYSLGEAVVSEHAVLDKGELKKISVAEGGEISGKLSCEAGTRIAPVVLIRMAALEAADEKIVHAGSVEDAETVNKRSLAECPDFPVTLALAGHDDDLRIRGVVRGVELVRSQELSVCTGNGSHSHNSAGLIPDFLEALALFREEIAGIVLFRSDDEAALALNSDFRHGVTFIQIRNNFLLNVHIFCSSLG